MNGATLIEMHCGRCGKRLLDFINRIEKGTVVIKKRCRHCGFMNERLVEAGTGV